MAKKTKKNASLPDGFVPFGITVKTELKADIIKIAQANRRKPIEEARIALENHVKANPVSA